jgi:hypothetical protein
MAGISISISARQMPGRIGDGSLHTTLVVRRMGASRNTVFYCAHSNLWLTAKPHSYFTIEGI